MPKVKGRKRETVEAYILECPECEKQAAFEPPNIKGVRPPECATCDETMLTLSEA